MKVYDFIEDMLKYKESLGYSRRSYACFLDHFRRFLLQNYPEATFLTEQIMLHWCQRRETENAGFRKSVGVLREFSKYLFSVGRSECILSLDYLPKQEKYTPYIFTDEELITLFSSCDQMQPTKKSPTREIIFPMMIKLIYFCGLRPNEGRELLKQDVDLKNGILLIRENKAHRERKIPIATDVLEKCREYDSKISTIYPHRNYFFPSPNGNAYPAKWLTHQFLTQWNHVKPITHTARVRVYDLRHRYATAIMMKWLDEKADLNTMIPYLSTYMGHVKFSDTAYYIHLLPKNLLETDSINWHHFGALLPEVQCDE